MTRAPLCGAGTARRRRSCSPGRSAPLAIAVALLAAVWIIAHLVTPDPSGYLVAGRQRARRPRRGRPRALPQLARARAARDGVRGGLHRRQLAADAGREPPRLVAHRAREGRARRDRLRRGRHDLLAVHPGLRPGQRRRDARRAARRRPHRADAHAAAPRAARARRPLPAAGGVDARQPPRGVERAAGRHRGDHRHRRPDADPGGEPRGLRLASAAARSPRRSGSGAPGRRPWSLHFV